jgi:hypothetical protein
VERLAGAVVTATKGSIETIREDGDDAAVRICGVGALVEVEDSNSLACSVCEMAMKESDEDNTRLDVDVGSTNGELEADEIKSELESKKPVGVLIVGGREDGVDTPASPKVGGDGD